MTQTEFGILVWQLSGDHGDLAGKPVEEFADFTAGGNSPTNVESLSPEDTITLNYEQDLALNPWELANQPAGFPVPFIVPQSGTVGT